MDVASLLQDLSRPEKIVGLPGFIGEGEFSMQALSCQRRFLLQGELIAGEVVGIEADGRIQCSKPCRKGAIYFRGVCFSKVGRERLGPSCGRSSGVSHTCGGRGKAIDQIQADVPEAGVSGAMDRVSGLKGAMAAAQQGKGTVVEGLNADVKAVDSDTAKRGQQI